MTTSPDLKGAASHKVLVDTAAEAVHTLLADAQRWPEFFEPCVHVTSEHRAAGHERLRIWAHAGDEVKTWESEREHAANRSWITFRQTRPAPPITSMVGRWSVTEGSAGTSVALDHEFTASSADELAWTTQVTNENSRAELAGLAEHVRRASATQRRIEFEDAVDVAAPVDEVRRFLWDGARWPEVLPHVVAASVRETGPDAHTLTMTTQSDAGRHNTSSTRVLLPGGDIVYKQTTLPPLLDLHLGRWRIEPVAEWSRVTSEHVIRLREGAENDFDGDIRAALTAVRSALGRNSVATLRVARDRLSAT